MSDQLETLRGAVRDGVASIENLANVLSSRRVGPRVIARALPEVRGGCLALSGALEQLRAELPRVLGDDPRGIDAANEMLEHAAVRVASLAAELEAREEGPLDARDRLGLDAVVRAVAADLAGLVRLIDLLGVAVRSRTTALELSDLLAHKRTLMGAPSAPVSVTLDLGDQVTLVGDAFVVLDLLLFALAWVARRGVVHPLLSVRAAASGRMRVEIGRAPLDPLPGTTKRVLEIPVRTPLPREEDVLAAAARRAGIDLTYDPSGERVVLVL